MKMQCSKQDLAEGIGMVMKAATGRNTMPILECVLLTAEGDSYRLLGNDLELAIQTKPMPAEVFEEGMIALEARMFSDIIRRLPSEHVYIETLENYITIIRSGSGAHKSEFKILGQNGGDFPLMPEAEPEKCFEIPAAEFRNMIRQTIFAVSTDESRPAFMGELLQIADNVLSISAMDGFKVAKRVMDMGDRGRGEEISMKVPGKTMAELYRAMPADERSDETLKICFSEKHALFETDTALFVTCLLEGSFIDIDSLLNSDYTTKTTINRMELLSSLERAALISRETRKNPVRLNIDSECVRITSNTESGSFYEEIPAETDGIELEIAFNPRYIIDVLKVLDDTRAVFRFTTPISPCVIKGEEFDYYFYLILPLRPKS